jgi:aldehyde:ferredoxin oxidoreductase
MGAKRLKAVAVTGTQGVTIAEPEAFADCTLSIAKELHGPCSYPRSPELNPNLVRDFGARFITCTSQCAIPHCSRSYSSVPGVIRPEKEYRGEVFCVSGIFGGGGPPYDWKTGFQAGVELAQISQDLGLNHWELGIGLVPWLKRCYQEGLLTDFDGEPFDLDVPHFWDTLFHKIACREGIGDALAEGGTRAARILGTGEEFIPEYYNARGFAAHWDGHGDRSGNVIFFPYWLVTALQWAVSTRDPISSGHGYGQNVMRWASYWCPDQGLDYETIADVGARVYGTRQATHPESGYEAKAFPAVWHDHYSVTKDSLTLCDQMYPRIYSNKTGDHFARAENGMAGPSFGYHMFRLATGMQIGEDEFNRMAERAFNLERALQVRNWARTRVVDEEVVPSFERVETWVNPLVGERVGLDRERFGALLDEYYALRGWDQETGRPTLAKLQELGLSDVASELADEGLLE